MLPTPEATPAGCSQVSPSKQSVLLKNYTLCEWFQVCSYFKDPLICIGPVATDQVKDDVEHTAEALDTVPGLAVRAPGYCAWSSGQSPWILCLRSEPLDTVPGLAVRAPGYCAWSSGQSPWILCLRSEPLDTVPGLAVRAPGYCAWSSGQSPWILCLV
uniref:Uncharacterized protein n=1 Tax=Timema genevievae TaxID=629358 RepID=A0A7R9K5M7_TIMGE|nr:unnamed protein product [Timema genevievae]